MVVGSKIQLGVSEIYLSIRLSVVRLGVLCIRMKDSNCIFHRYVYGVRRSVFPSVDSGVGGGCREQLHQC